MNSRSPILALLSFVIGSNAFAGEIMLYEHDSFRGRSLRAEHEIPDLARGEFNDRASSVVVRSGRWQLCSEAFFRGECVILERGEYPQLGNRGLNDRVSSLREVGAGPGGAPDRAKIVLFEDVGEGGRNVGVDGEVRNLERIGFNDRANSLVVRDGHWELCEHEDFRGHCEVFAPGRYPNLGSLSGRVSSARPVAARPAIPGPGAPGWGAQARAVLFDGRDFSGRHLVVDQQVLSDFAGTGFNDRASSLRVEGGYWIFCSEAHFLGTCRTFGPGEYAALPPDLSNRISSGRRISTGYPYRGNPEWGGR